MAHIHNPYGNGTDKKNTLIDCGLSGIDHRTELNSDEDYYVANLTIPWSTINGHNSDAVDHSAVGAAAGDRYLGNFFRVMMAHNVSMCEPDTCFYGAWSPTLAVPPQFHISKLFGEIKLV